GGGARVRGQPSHPRSMWQRPTAPWVRLTSRPFPIDLRSRRGRTAVKYNRRQGGWQRRGGMRARRPSMSAAFVFISLCAALVLILSAWPASRARAQDDDDQGEDSCGSAMLAENEGNQGEDNAQGAEKRGGGMERQRRQ